MVVITIVGNGFTGGLNVMQLRVATCDFAAPFRAVKIASSRS